MPQHCSHLGSADSLRDRTTPEMNLRSVFTVEQQRILQRYYENGMTNQSKNCFQLILQCAQETKLDFSVVRTWVGNKRRKMSSKNSESGAATAGTVSGTSLAAPDITVRNVVNIARPSSQQSSWTSANKDVIVTEVSKDYEFQINCIGKSQVKLNKMRLMWVSASCDPVAELTPWYLLSHFNYRLL
ncbi:Highly Divergent Homeobox [Manis pentadactyla]|nr:Highly Divergent Homeobox [Manis pentadactyla]